ncbi:MAG: 50S ribosomal protein L4 [Rhodocyclaceae bacterium]
MELNVINNQGQQAQKLNVNDELFARAYNEALVHQVVVAYQANARFATRKQKTRAEVRHTTTKPWRQKGTGRARAGSNGSPLWRGGGRIFPNTPNENFTQKVNRKMYRAAISVMLSELIRQQRVVVIDNFEENFFDSPKTKSFIEKFKAMNLSTENTLVITDNLTENLYLSSRNLPTLLVLEAQEINPMVLIKFDKLVVTRQALSQIEENLQ